MRAARRLLATAIALAPLVIAASCSDERKEPTNPGWFAPCAGDSDCSVGACRCGRCSVACGEFAACSAGPPGSACFARGSIAHEAFCGDGLAPAALCLATCARDEDCAEGLTCVVGACVPPPRPPVSDAGSDDHSNSSPDACAGESCSGAQTAADRRAFNESALLPPDFYWVPEVVEDDADDADDADDVVYTADGFADRVDYDVLCAPEDPCPALEQVLTDDSCLEIVRSCDLIRVADQLGGSYMYWYTGYGTPPVAAIRNGSGRAGRFATTRDLSCTTTEVTMCSTCGLLRPRCENVPGSLPEPPAAAPVSGCTCESDGVGSARVSLDCFCSIQDCPSYETLRADCPFDDPGPSVTLQAFDVCGSVQFDIREYSGQRLVYDPTTGELVGALAFSQGPVTAPCNTYRVSAGVTPECAQPSPPCGCNARTPGISEVPLPRCEETDWFQAL